MALIQAAAAEGQRVLGRNDRQEPGGERAAAWLKEFEQANLAWLGVAGPSRVASAAQLQGRRASEHAAAAPNPRSVGAAAIQQGHHRTEAGPQRAGVEARRADAVRRTLPDDGLAEGGQPPEGAVSPQRPWPAQAANSLPATHVPVARSMVAPETSPETWSPVRLPAREFGPVAPATSELPPASVFAAPTASVSKGLPTPTAAEPSRQSANSRIVANRPPQHPVRLHVETTPVGIRVWAGVDGQRDQVAQAGESLRAHFQDAAARGGRRLAALVLNGTSIHEIVPAARLTGGAEDHGA